LYANKRYDEARKVLKFMARFNSAKVTPIEIESIVFDTEFEKVSKANNKIDHSS
jgi:hypothetical protein